MAGIAAPTVRGFATHVSPRRSTNARHRRPAAPPQHLRPLRGLQRRPAHRRPRSAVCPAVAAPLAVVAAKRPPRRQPPSSVNPRFQLRQPTVAAPRCAGCSNPSTCFCGPLQHLARRFQLAAMPVPAPRRASCNTPHPRVCLLQHLGSPAPGGHRPSIPRASSNIHRRHSQHLPSPFPASNDAGCNNHHHPGLGASQQNHRRRFQQPPPPFFQQNTDAARASKSCSDLKPAPVPASWLAGCNTSRAGRRLGGGATATWEF